MYDCWLRCAGRGAMRGLWACALVCVLLTGGCGTRTAAVEDPGAGAGQDEIVQYVPQDDGIPLSSTELAALNSTGELDAALSHDAMDDITIQYKYFLHRGRPSFERFLRRAEVYLPYVKRVFRERGLPEDLAYIALIESGYNPVVVSRAGAAGTWQFMPFTGQKYGLAQDWWMDERHDTFKATHAAADYLTKLYGDFKDWHLAIAAYNAGEGKIGRALDGTGAKSFFELVRKNGMLDERSQLRDETKQYVPRFLAVCKMMRNLETLGFVPPDPGAATSLTRVDVRPGTDLTAVARAVGMDWAEFSSHNPAYRRHVSPADRGSSLYVPGHAQEKALACLDDARAGNGGGWMSYTVAKKDSWQRISARSGVPVGVLKKVNDNKRLKAGTILRIPGGGASPAAVQIARATPASVKRKADGAIKNAPGEKVAVAPAPNKATKAGAKADSLYVAQAGDTVYAIARRHGTDVDSVLRANRLASPQQLQAGQQLRLPGTSPAAAGAKDRNAVATYRVQPGDTMWSIARKHKLPPQDLIRLNKMNDAASLRPGDTIRVALN